MADQAGLDTGKVVWAAATLPAVVEDAPRLAFPSAAWRWPQAPATHVGAAAERVAPSLRGAAPLPPQYARTPPSLAGRGSGEGGEGGAVASVRLSLSFTPEPRVTEYDFPAGGQRGATRIGGRALHLNFAAPRVVLAKSGPQTELMSRRRCRTASLLHGSRLPGCYTSSTCPTGLPTVTAELAPAGDARGDALPDGTPPDDGIGGDATVSVGSGGSVSGDGDPSASECPWGVGLVSGMAAGDGTVSGVEWLAFAAAKGQSVGGLVGYDVAFGRCEGDSLGHGGGGPIGVVFEACHGVQRVVSAAADDGGLPWTVLDARQLQGAAEAVYRVWLPVAMVEPFTRCRLRVTKGSSKAGLRLLSHWSPVYCDAMPGDAMFGSWRLQLCGVDNNLVFSACGGAVYLDCNFATPNYTLTQVQMELSANLVSIVARAGDGRTVTCTQAVDSDWWRAGICAEGHFLVGGSHMCAAADGMTQPFCGFVGDIVVTAGSGDLDVPKPAAKASVPPLCRRATQCSPLLTVRELEAWSVVVDDPLSLKRSLVPRRLRVRAAGPKVLVCHDCGPTVYRHDSSAATEWTESWLTYSVQAWSRIDVFAYFAHSFISFPPTPWIDAAHSNGVLALGTLILEWRNGAAELHRLLDSSTCIKKLVQLTAHYGFDGWLLNFECPLEATLCDKLVSWVRSLTTALREDNSESVVLWYDAVTIQGNLQWQSQLNANNKPFFDVCDGLFADYHWAAPDPGRSAAVAQHRHSDVYMGVDVWGRGTFGGGGYNTIEAVEAAMSAGCSVAIFAPAWTYEACGGNRSWDDFAAAERRFWLGQQTSDNLLANADCLAGTAEWERGQATSDHMWRPADGKCADSSGRSFSGGLVFSHILERAEQTVTLPEGWRSVTVSCWYRGTGPNYADTLIISVHDDEGALLSSSNTIIASEAWCRYSVTLDAAECSTKTIQLQLQGKDAEHWAGNFGTHVAGMSVTAAGDFGGMGCLSKVPPRCFLSVPIGSSFDVGMGKVMCMLGRVVRNSGWRHMSRQGVVPAATGTECQVGKQVGSHAITVQLASASCPAYLGGAMLDVDIFQDHRDDPAPTVGVFHFQCSVGTATCDRELVVRMVARCDTERVMPSDAVVPLLVAHRPHGEELEVAACLHRSFVWQVAEHTGWEQSEWTCTLPSSAVELSKFCLRRSGNAASVLGALSLGWAGVMLAAEAKRSRPPAIKHLRVQQLHGDGSGRHGSATHLVSWEPFVGMSVTQHIWLGAHYLGQVSGSSYLVDVNDIVDEFAVDVSSVGVCAIDDLGRRGPIVRRRLP